jgi:hypothetical protein
MLKAACFEEKIHREVEKVEEGSHKRDVRVKTFSTSSTLRLKNSVGQAGVQRQGTRPLAGADLR